MFGENLKIQKKNERSIYFLLICIILNNVGDSSTLNDSLEKFALSDRYNEAQLIIQFFLKSCWLDSFC